LARPAQIADASVQPVAMCMRVCRNRGAAQLHQRIARRWSRSTAVAAEMAALDQHPTAKPKASIGLRSLGEVPRRPPPATTGSGAPPSVEVRRSRFVARRENERVAQDVQGIGATASASPCFADRGRDRPPAARRNCRRLPATVGDEFLPSSAFRSLMASAPMVVQYGPSAGRATASTGRSQMPWTAEGVLAPSRPVTTDMAVNPRAPAWFFRSAWMPAPPPESEPAMVRARGGGRHKPNLAVVVFAKCSKLRRARPVRRRQTHLAEVPSTTRPMITTPGGSSASAGIREREGHGLHRPRQQFPRR